MIVNKDIGFILSTGRTGTMFFEDYITQTSKVAFCHHEPNPSRRFIPLTNMFNRGIISGSLYRKTYFSARKKMIQKSSRSRYIESSNFMWAGVTALNEKIKNIRVLHLIRHPEDYIISHFNYGFWKGYKRLLRKYFPYFIADLPLSDRELDDPVFILAARWLVINSKIASYSESNPYMFMRFEDIFQSSAETGSSNLDLIRHFFDLEPINQVESIQWLSKPINRSHKSDSGIIKQKHKDFIRKNLSPLMKQYNYPSENDSRF